MQADALIRDYLRQLDAAAGRLPADRRGELTSEVRDHIEAALDAAGKRDEVTVRNVLERLGPPEEIVEAEVDPGVQVGAGDGVAVVARSEEGRPSIGAVEIIALLMLTLGAFVVPLIGPLIGLVFVWLSNVWTRTQKIIASAIVVALLVVPILLLLNVGTSNGVFP